MNQFYTAESVTEGHPDKLCDLIADSVLDDCLSHDALSRVACEVLATKGQVIVAGEITSLHEPQIPAIVRSVLRKVGYDPARYAVQCLIHKQSPDIAAGVDCSLEQRRESLRDPVLRLGAGDQGVMVGYACSETPQMLPLPVVLAHRLAGCLTTARKSGMVRGLRPDGKAQVTVEYDEDGRPLRLDTVVLSAQHSPEKPADELFWELTDKVLAPALQALPPDEDTNVLVIGGSGAGKSRSYAIPNALNGGNCSMVICDPKSEILRKTGGALKANGYEVRVFDLLSPDTSFCYNPLAYVRDDKDVLRLIETLIQSTTPPGAQSSDPFWTKSETALLQALVLYLMHEAPKEEQNFAMVMEMLAAAEVREEDEEYESPLDILFARLEMRDPESIAVKQYHVFKMGAGKTLKSILISVGVRLSAFNLPQIARLTYTDDLHLEELGEKKVALFCCIPDSDRSLNYLVGMIYGQLIQTLYYVADRKYKGRLPVPVHLLIDEAPNIALPTDNFLPWLSTMRSRAIFCSYIAQNMAQIKALFKEQWESLVGLCDEFLYLGGNEKETHKYVSELMGKETLDTNTYGHSRGRSGSFSVNDQQTGRELLTPDEVRMLDNRKAILFVRGERPMLDDKYDLMRHPNIKLTEDGGAPPYDYTQAKDAANDLDYSPEQYEDFELLDPEDFLKP